MEPASHAHRPTSRHERPRKGTSPSRLPTQKNTQEESYQTMRGVSPPSPALGSGRDGRVCEDWASRNLLCQSRTHSSLKYAGALLNAPCIEHSLTPMWRNVIACYIAQLPGMKGKGKAYRHRVPHTEKHARR